MVPGRADWPQRVTLSTGVIIGAFGVAVLIAWSVHFAPLIQPSPGLPPTTRDGALAMLLSGSSLSLLSAGRKRAAWVCALLLSILAVLVCDEYILNHDLGIDQLLGKGYIVEAGASPGRLSPLAALCYLGVSLALLALSSRRLGGAASAVAGIIGSVLIAIGSVVLLSYLLQHTFTYRLDDLRRMSLQTAAALVLLGLSFMILALRENLSRRTMPRWLPLAIALSLSAGVLGVWQVLVRHEEEDLPLISSIILAGGVLGAMLVGISTYLAQKATLRSREMQEGKIAFERLFNAAPDALLVVDRAGRIVRANGRVTGMFAYPREQVLGRHIENLIPEGFHDLPEGFHDLLQPFHDQAGPVDSCVPQTGMRLEGQGRRADGSEFPVEVDLSPIQLGPGAPVLAVVRDITERKQAQEALRRSEEKFRGVFEQGPIGIGLMGKDYHFIQVNAALCRMLGYSESELMAMTPFDVTHPDDRSLSIDLVERLFSTDAPVQTMEKRHVKKNGEVMWGSLNVSVIHDQQGRPLYGLGMLEDITNRKRAEEELRALNQRLSLATRSASLGVWDWNRRTGLAIWDDRMFEIFGLPRQDRVAREDWAPRFHPEDLPVVDDCLNTLLEGRTQGTREFRLILPDGSRRYVSIAGAAAVDENGNATGVVGIAQDTTERKQMQMAIEASTRLSALGMMAGGVAHEINNPLSVIHSMSTDLADMVAPGSLAPREAVARKVVIIRETAERIARIVKSLRQIAREGSGDMFHPCSLAKIVTDTLEICRAKFMAHGVELLVPEVLPDINVPCREVQIEQTLLNLLQNAFDAVVEVHGARWVRLRVESRDGSVAISVLDSGPGIPPALRSRLMEPFFTTKPVGKGTGLGLSLSKTIAEDHGGRLEYSEDNGHTCFSLVLPMSRKAEAA